ncbi:hypothetical protein [Streptomyces sp. CNQ085]|uniref:hypothetical protein n=1 Tax=Streptomyces sp. CNQ085 TaxID=2886944 RepID=UPI001F50E103|nr:hypothetical protein [Streptomyces sp. CNQ085]MCI0382847.1 hypothetical protein [Streptomyces sp. CNQ085]
MQRPFETPVIPARRRTGPLLAALAAGLVMGGVGFGAAWALTGGSGGEGGPAADARAACDVLERFGESRYAEEGPAGEAALNRWGAAQALSASAAAGDERYEPLAEALRKSHHRVLSTFGFDARAKKDLERARGICADL